MAFHEKAGRSQVDSFLFFVDKCFSRRVSHCRHASIRTLKERFASLGCSLGVLGAAGAAICLAPCGSLLVESNLGQAIDAVTGTRL